MKLVYFYSAYEQDEDASDDDSDDDDDVSSHEETYDVTDDCPLLSAAPESSANDRRRHSGRSGSSSDSGSTTSFRSGGALSRVFQGLVNFRKDGVVAQSDSRPSAQQVASNAADAESNVGIHTAKNGRQSSVKNNTMRLINSHTNESYI